MHSFFPAIKMLWHVITKSNGRAYRITYSLVLDVLVKKETMNGLQLISDSGISEFHSSHLLTMITHRPQLSLSFCCGTACIGVHTIYHI